MIEQQFCIIIYVCEFYFNRETNFFKALVEVARNV